MKVVRRRFLDEKKESNMFERQDISQSCDDDNTTFEVTMYERKKDLLVEFHTKSQQKAYVQITPLGESNKDTLIFEIIYAIEAFPPTEWRFVPPQFKDAIVIFPPDGEEGIICFSCKQYKEINLHNKKSDMRAFDIVLQEAIMEMRKYLKTQEEGGDER